MPSLNTFQPNWVSVPGETILDLLSNKRITIPEFSSLMHLSEGDVNTLLQGGTIINERIASKLTHTIGGSTDFWLKRERAYREAIERKKRLEAEWIKELPTRDMIRNGWIDVSRPILESCLNFFNMADVWSWERRCKELNNVALFRKSEKLVASPASLLTWIRQGEIQAEQIACADWNEDAFKNSFDQIKQLSRLKDPKSFLPRLQNICADCGVCLVIAPTPQNCPASGVAKFLANGKAFILMSFRYKTDDHFWFTFFHEAAHLLLHRNLGVSIDGESTSNSATKEETEANNFAADVLIPPVIRSAYFSKKIGEREIKSMAKEAGVSLGIIVGQMQHLKKVPIQHFNTFKKRFNWDDINSSSHS